MIASLAVLSTFTHWPVLMVLAPAAALTVAYLSTFVAWRGRRLRATREGGLTALYRRDLQEELARTEEWVARSAG